ACAILVLINALHGVSMRWGTSAPQGRPWPGDRLIQVGRTACAFPKVRGRTARISSLSTEVRGMVEAPSFVHLTDFRTAGSWVPGRFSLASFCHGYASWQPSHPLRPSWSMGRNRGM